MKDNGFLKMINRKLPPETELAVELQCREVMACEDTEKIKAFCIDIMKNHAKSEVVLSDAMMRVVELEAKLAMLETIAENINGIKKIAWWLEKLKLQWKYRKVTKRHSRDT